MLKGTFIDAKYLFADIENLEAHLESVRKISVIVDLDKRPCLLLKPDSSNWEGFYIRPDLLNQGTFLVAYMEIIEKRLCELRIKVSSL